MTRGTASRCYPARGIHFDGCRHGVAGRSRSEAQRERRDVERQRRRSAGQRARQEREQSGTLCPPPEATGRPISGDSEPTGQNHYFAPSGTELTVEPCQTVLDKVPFVIAERPAADAEAPQPSRRTECGECGKEFRTPEVADRHHKRSHKRPPRGPDADPLFDVPTRDGYSIAGDIPLDPSMGGSWGALTREDGTPAPAVGTDEAEVEYHTSTVDPAEYWFRNGLPGVPDWPADPMRAQLSPEGRAMADELKALIGPDDLPGGRKAQPRVRARKARPVPPPGDHIGTDPGSTPCTCDCHHGGPDRRLECDQADCFRLDNAERFVRPEPPVGVWAGFAGKPSELDPHGWDTDEVCNEEPWRTGKALVSRRGCRAKWHPDRECLEGKHVDGEGRYWTDPKYGPASFPNRLTAEATA